MIKEDWAALAWTHRGYFRRFDLNVEQYGEILIAQVFNGIKKGDAQRCYDIETSGKKVRDRLLAGGISREIVEKCLSGSGGGAVRIEVKSKLAQTPAGVAHVIHCSDAKIHGAGKPHPPATHFAVILFDGEGTAEHAWLFSNEIARRLRRKKTKSRYISVPSLKEASRDSTYAILDICNLINEAASRPLLVI